MRTIGDLTQASSVRHVDAFDDLVEMRLTVARLHDDLLDFNPVLALMAEGLQKALDLELEARRCNIQRNDPT